MTPEQRIYGSNGTSLVRLYEVDLRDAARTAGERSGPGSGLELMVDLGDGAYECLSLRLDPDGVRKLRLALQRLERAWAATKTGDKW